MRDDYWRTPARTCSFFTTGVTVAGTSGRTRKRTLTHHRRTSRSSQRRGTSSRGRPRELRSIWKLVRDDSASASVSGTGHPHRCSVARKCRFKLGQVHYDRAIRRKWPQLRHAVSDCRPAVPARIARPCCRYATVAHTMMFNPSCGGGDCAAAGESLDDGARRSSSSNRRRCPPSRA